MTDLVWPVDIIPSEVEWRLIDNVSVSQSPFSGATRRVSRPGTRWGARLTFNNLSGANRHRVMALVAALRGRANSIYVPDVSTVQRGSMSAPELLTNADLSSVTGWSVQSGTLSARNGVMRATAAGPPTILETFQAPSVVAFAPYALRSLFQMSAGFGVLPVGAALSDGVGQDQLYTASRGLITVSRVCLSGSSTQYPFVINSASGYLTGDFVDHLYASSARCLQVDNGLNAALYSDQLDNAAWSRIGSTMSANFHTAPDGTVTAEKWTEDTSTGQHSFYQSGLSRTSVDADLCGYGYFAPSSGARDVRIVVGNTLSGNYGYAIFNLAAGTVTSVANVGTNTNTRAFIKNAGGFYFCCVISYATAAATHAVQFDLINSGSAVYTGTTGALAVWRCGAAVTSSPTRGAQTVAAALASGTAQTGSSLYFKGGPASISGLYAAGDMVEILLSSASELTKSQMVRLTADLDTDATGCGLLQFEPALRSAPSNSAPIIGTKPLCRMMLAGSDQSWQTVPGLFSDFVLDLVEDVT